MSDAMEVVDPGWLRNVAYAIRVGAFGQHDGEDEMDARRLERYAAAWEAERKAALEQTPEERAFMEAAVAKAAN